MSRYFKILLVIFIVSKSVSLTAQDIDIEFFGHASFMFTIEDGRSVLIDPVKLTNHTMPEGLTPDIVTVSHLHRDHNNVSVIEGNPVILYGLENTGEGLESFVKIDTIINDIHIYNIKCNHRDPKVSPILNTIFVYEFDGFRIAHLGDLGVLLTNEQLEQIGELDILMIPVGGRYTIVPEQADKILEDLKVKQYIFPMHYKCDIVDFVPFTIDDFLANKKIIKTIEGNKIEVNLNDPPQTPTYIKMDYK